MRRVFLIVCNIYILNKNWGCALYVQSENVLGPQSQAGEKSFFEIEELVTLHKNPSQFRYWTKTLDNKTHRLTWGTFPHPGN